MGMVMGMGMGMGLGMGMRQAGHAARGAWRVWEGGRGSYLLGYGDLHGRLLLHGRAFPFLSSFRPPPSQTQENDVARISAEDCLIRVPNRFALCVLAAKRARQLASGELPLVDCDNKGAVTSLREIAAGRITTAESVEQVLREHIAEVNALNAHRTLSNIRGQASSRPR